MWAQLMVCLVLCGTASSMQCPDGRKCEGSSICCKLSGEDGYACCDRPQFMGASLLMFPPEDNYLLQMKEASGVLCLDGSMCPVEYSCLRTPDAVFACCPWKEGISCADGRHCCPLDSHCSADGRFCLQNEVPISPAKVSAVQCPDGESECPNDSTCCMMPDGTWGCCPMPEALCCEDKIHCCPHNTTCDLPHARCFAAFGEQALRKKFPANKRALVLDPPQINICPGNQSSCPDVATCCLLPTGQYGCCLLQNAVCCSDRLHCCPQGTTCDLTHSKCTMTPQRSWPITRLAVDLHLSAHDVQCDVEHRCPDGNTCCRRGPSTWGCCPLEEAVCCSDNIHCCPKGYTCDLSAGSCLRDSRSTPRLAKAGPSSPASSAGKVVQCDTHTSCPDGHTCCTLSSGVWGCCPLPKAVCCKDGTHCCPADYYCDLSHGTCTRNGDSVPWLEKKPAIVGITSSSRDVRCDYQFSCADGQTCCWRGMQGWACCPLPQAVCCADHVHCCPSGYTCDSAHSSCVKGGGPSQRVLLVLGLPRQDSDAKCDDRTSSTDGHTCCQLASGKWGSCPFPEAVCCEDHQHCCPSGYTCNVAAQTCEKQPWPRLLPAGGLLISSRTATSGRDVSCDSQHYCHDHQTCCKTRSGGWACCPYDKGSCCSDKRHCCPPDFRCSKSGYECTKVKPLRWDARASSPRSTQAQTLL
ncbi:progranulin isoform X2 [Rhineura floridana]|uniref:progranulin isoform X2 n=1 Tax=Rhineura floridana TaxID=261503 RepID=UPI002AC87EFD|nr:progranulin isoform X2 [Rhineura floridana]